MKREYRYISNMGLAFDEGRVMKKLSEMGEEGWFLKEVSLFRYKLVKGDPQKLIYAVDYNEVYENKSEYLEIFEGSDWKLVCSYGPFHFFSAPDGTVPIYTDKESHLEKYKSSKTLYNKIFIITVITFFISVIGEFLLRNNIKGSIAETLLFTGGVISLVIAVPSMMVSIALFKKYKRI